MDLWIEWENKWHNHHRNNRVGELIDKNTTKEKVSDTISVGGFSDGSRDKVRIDHRATQNLPFLSVCV